ncbi:Cytochrome P450 4C1 [Orchesella cincta]|uniref:Cytochrome P450 4C1 n=1 Tax=Orchesella cincta TaxID=48709 RepID=A0A1D2M576_ORCCI|nr:Cytochrome P450 4C1 [Orchesella cincta]
MLFLFISDSPLSEYNGNQVDVPVGTQVAIVPWAIHRNEDYWPNPETFNPDRFLPEECAKRHAYAYLPFSAGPRNCIGLKLGLNEMKTVAAHVLRNFNVSSTDRFGGCSFVAHVTITPERDYNFVMKRRAF